MSLQPTVLTLNDNPFEIHSNTDITQGVNASLTIVEKALHEISAAKLYSLGVAHTVYLKN